MKTWSLSLLVAAGLTPMLSPVAGATPFLVRAIAILVLAFWCVEPRPARGDWITVGFSGKITDVAPDGLDYAAVGAPFSGTYTANPNFSRVPNSCPSGTSDAECFYAELTDFRPRFLDVSIDGKKLDFSAQLQMVRIVDDDAEDGDAWSTYPLTRLGLVPEIFFSDSSGTRLTSAEMFVNTRLLGWDTAEFRLGYTLCGSFDPGCHYSSWSVVARGTISALAAVPEPASGLLGACAVLGLASLRGRRVGNG